MRFARKLMLLAVTAIAAVALSASTASAQSVEIQAETGEHCSPTCDIHVTSAGPSSLTLYNNGMLVGVVSSCTDEFVATLGENGTGFIHTYENNHATAPTVCTRINCADDETEEAEWDLTLSEAAGSGNERENANVRFCLRQEGGTPLHCTVNIEVTHAVDDPHRYTFRAVEEHCPLGGTLEVRVNGTWQTENSDYEIHHVDDEIPN